MQTQFRELSDSQWGVLKNILPHQRKRKHDLRQITNTILYLHRVGTQWRNLASNFPLWKSAYYYFRRWSGNGLWEKLNDWLVDFERKRHGKEVRASLICADSQSIKAGPFVSEDKGIDGKKVTGRKRHILVDTLA